MNQEELHILLKVFDKIHCWPGVDPLPRLTSLMHTHWPSTVSFHRLTLLSPPETAKMLPVTDQETCQTTSSKVCKTRWFQELEVPSLVQRMTRRSWEQLAITVRDKPIDGAQAASRTQSEWPSSLASSTHSLSSLKVKKVKMSWKNVNAEKVLSTTTKCVEEKFTAKLLRDYRNHRWRNV